MWKVGWCELMERAALMRLSARDTKNAAWRALRGTVKRGVTISMIHAGDRSKCRFVTTVKRDDGKPAIMDLTWYLGNAFGERYSDRTRLLSIQDAASLVAWLARELFGTESALKADWL